MNTQLKWKKKLFSSSTQVYSNWQLVGQLKKEIFSNSCACNLNDDQYYFKIKVFFNQKTDIIDLKENKVIGEITYSTWRTNAKVVLFDQQTNWKYDNIWNTKWSMANSSETQIRFVGSQTSGEIESNTDNILLIMCGLFIPNYYRQASIAVFIILLFMFWHSAKN